MAAARLDAIVLAGHMLDGTDAPVQGNVAIRVAGGRIESIHTADAPTTNAGCQVIDLRKSWVMPGLIDTHLHLWGLEPGAPAPAGFELRLARAQRQARDLLHAGFTTVRDLGSPIAPWIRDSNSTDPPAAPRILAAHVGLTGARGPWLIPQPTWWETRVVRGVASAKEAVRRLHDEGVDVIKVGASTGPQAEGFGDIPTMTAEEIRVVCETAHGLGLPVAAHAIGSEAVRRCVQGNVDTIEHGYGLSDDVCEAVAANNAWIVPTLRTRTVRPTPEAQATAREQIGTLRRGVAAGIRYAAGTDSVGDGYTAHGPGNAIEIELMGRVLAPDAALAAATRDAARMLGLAGEIGTLEPGKSADLIAVREDPRRGLRALQRVEFVMHRGRVVRDDLSAERR